MESFCDISPACRDIIPYAPIPESIEPAGRDGGSLMRMTHVFSSDLLSVLLPVMFTVCVMAVTAPARAQKENVIIHGNARFTVIAPGCIRMEYSDKGEFIDEPSYFAVNRAAAFTDFSLGRPGNPLIIDTGVILLTYNDDGQPFNEENLKAEFTFGERYGEWRPGLENTGNLGGTIRTVDGVMGPVDLGQGLLSRDGWYLLDDSKRSLLTADWVKARQDERATDWYLFAYGTDYADALRTMAELAGTVPMPRKYTLGAWYSRYWPYTSDDYRRIVAEYHKEDFPLDIMVLDMDWHRTGWTGWSINRELLPDVEDLLDWFHNKGLYVTFNVHPADGVGAHEDMYEAFMRDLGEDPASEERVLYDAGNKKYLDTLFKHTHAPLEDIGVDFWWLDWQQYPYTRSVAGLTNLEWLNEYYYRHTQRTGLRGQSFSRWAGWGDHRHPIHFSGDSDTGWAMLAFMVPMTSTAGNIGAFFWSHDIGGHMGLRNPESYTRWVQFGAVSAALRSHSTRSPDQDRRPWKYPAWAEASMRKSFHLRSEIFPYIYSSVWQSYKDMTPLNRPMYLLYPERDRAYKNPQQFYFGDSLLAAPVVAPGEGIGKVGTQVVWFPEGVWYNWFTGERFQGETEILAAADIDEFPLYARGGEPVPMQPYTERMTTTPLTELIVRAYPGEDGRTGAFTLYEDDGVTLAYQNGAYATTELTYTRNGGSVTMAAGPAKGEFEGQVAERKYVFELPCTQKPSEVKVVIDPPLPPLNNETLPKFSVEYDDKALVTRVSVIPVSLDHSVTVTLAVQEADNGIFQRAAAARRIKGLLGEKAKSDDPKNALVAYMNEYPNGPLSNTLLAIGGAGVFLKNEALYIYKGVPRAYFYARPGLLDGEKFSYRIIDRFGESETTAYEAMPGTDSPMPPAAPGLPAMSDPPDFGVRSFRLLQTDFTVGGKKFSFEEIIEKKPSYITKWTVAGPFDFKRNVHIQEQKYGPELEGVDFKAVYEGVSGTNVGWRRAKPDDEGVVDLNDHYYITQDDKVAYAATYIYSSRDQDAVFLVNSDDRAEMWVNGEKVISNHGRRGIDTETDNVTVPLKKGPNPVLLKVSQHNFDWQFKVAVGAVYALKQSYTLRE